MDDLRPGVLALPPIYEDTALDIPLAVKCASNGLVGDDKLAHVW